MKKLNPISPEKLIKILKQQGLEKIRQKVSHINISREEFLALL